MRERRIVLAAVALAAAVLLWLRCGPLPDGLLDDRGQESTVVVDRHGVVLYEARADDGTRRMRLDPAALPPSLVSATIAAEDRRFRLHPGVDPIALVRAAAHDLRGGRIVEGGSTITQQVAKLLLAASARRQAGAGRVVRRRTLATKLREAVVALRLEHRFTKNEILALYLDLAPYGQQVVGAERASRNYFGCTAGMLTPAQAAFLAALPQRPSGFNPLRDPDAVLAHQRRVIDSMQANGFLTSPAAREARAERVRLRHPSAAFGAPHFVEMALDGYGENRPGRIETTLDAELQADVQGIVRSQRALLDRHDAHNVAVVVLHNATGEWLAWEGSGDYNDQAHGGAINGPLVPRQAGSALKPFTYALAFESGYTPASVLPDVPAHFATAEEGVVYTPRNYDGQFRGPMLARRALAGSENVPAVALASELGVAELVRFLRQAGFSTLDKTASYYGLGITLGNAEVSLAELVAAYAALARGGVPVRPTAVRSASGASVVVSGAAPWPRPARLVSARTAFWITDILSDPVAREYAFGRGGSLEFPFEVAAKTGTSQGYHDNWTIGYTHEVTVGVWVGNFDRAPLKSSSGVTGAGPIFHAVMLAAARRVAGWAPGDADPPIAPVPAGLVREPICALSGLRAGPWCPSRVGEWLPAGDALTACTWHQQRGGQTTVMWPPKYRAWANDRGLLAAGEPRGVSEHRTADSNRHPANGAEWTTLLQIVNPPAGAIYVMDPTLRREFQTLPLRVAADATAARITWTVDGSTVGTMPAEAAFTWPLAPGEHTINARDVRGRTAEARILVK